MNSTVSADLPVGADPLADVSIDYVEIYVGDLERAAFDWVDKYAFAVAGTGGSADHRSIALRRGRLILVLTQATSGRHPASAYVLAHGDRVADIALRTPDVAAACRAAADAGATVLRGPTRHAGREPVVTATVRGFRQLTHTLVQRGPGGEPGLPVGFSPALRATDGRIDDRDLIDAGHLAICGNAGDLDRMSGFYRSVFGFRRIFDETLVLGDRAMESAVMQSRSGAVTLTLLEPQAANARPGEDHTGPFVPIFTASGHRRDTLCLEMPEGNGRHDVRC